ncbi:hypothetical protein ABTL91_20110, partial [Acinetobacter baumannii]
GTSPVVVSVCSPQRPRPYSSPAPETESVRVVAGTRPVFQVQSVLKADAFVNEGSPTRAGPSMA